MEVEVCMILVEDLYIVSITLKIHGSYEIDTNKMK